MKATNSSYNFKNSRERIKDILAAGDVSYKEVDTIPSRDRLTFTNGFYVNNTAALFVDIRNSSKLPEKYKKRVLARIYRAYISELVAIINSNDDCVEVNIHGDSVWGVFDARYQSQVDGVFDTAVKISSIIDYLNCRLNKQSIDPIIIGIGMDFGKILMIKAGYNGSGINDVVWMGDVVNQASKLCGNGNKNFNKEIMASSDFYSRLPDNSKRFLIWNGNHSCYHGNVINSNMSNWMEENGCK